MLYKLLACCPYHEDNTCSDLTENEVIVFIVGDVPSRFNLITPQEELSERFILEFFIK
jgi:hypothetical protein